MTTSQDLTSSPTTALMYQALRERLNSHEGPHPKRVAFDCDKTLIQGDIGEASLASLFLRGALRGEAWWAPLEAHGVVSTGDEGLQARYERAVSEREEGELLSSELFKELWSAYERLCELNIREGYLLAARFWAGYPLEQLPKLASSAVQEALSSSLEPCTHTGGLASRGVRVRPAMKALIQALHDEGVEVWVVSSSQQQLVEAMVAELGVPPERVIGIAFHPAEGRLGHEPVEPAPIEEGKRARFLSVHQRPPVAMFGDSRYDLPLMESAGWGVLIDHGDASLRERAASLGAHIISASEVDPR